MIYVDPKLRKEVYEWTKWSNDKGDILKENAPREIQIAFALMNIPCIISEIHGYPDWFYEWVEFAEEGDESYGSPFALTKRTPKSIKEKFRKFIEDDEWLKPFVNNY